MNEIKELEQNIYNAISKIEVTLSKFNLGNADLNISKKIDSNEISKLEEENLLLKEKLKRFWLILTFLIVLLFQTNFQIATALPMENYQSDQIVEELRLSVPIDYKETWLKAEQEIWEPWLSKQDGFLGRQIFYNKKKGEALLLVKWENRKLWKSISDEEVNKMQEIYEETVTSTLGIETNPFKFIYEGELFEQK